MRILTLPLFFLVYAKKEDVPEHQEMTNQELIIDASGKLKKLGTRAAGIYVNYLSGWSRADKWVSLYIFFK